MISARTSCRRLRLDLSVIWCIRHLAHLSTIALPLALTSALLNTLVLYLSDRSSSTLRALSWSSVVSSLLWVITGGTAFGSS